MLTLNADSTVDLIIWTSIEANSVIISTCIPMLMPLVELTLGENFLNGGDNGRLRTIVSYPEPPEHSPEDSERGFKASARQRGDWLQQVHVASDFPNR
jgi:hypothetical protein